MKIIVKHKKLGEGTVVSVNNGIVVVDFGNMVKQFQSEIFSNYFTFESEDDAEVQEWEEIYNLLKECMKQNIE